MSHGHAIRTSGRSTEKPSQSPILEERAAGDPPGYQPDSVNYRGIVETANQGIWVIDAQQRTTFVNAKLADALGYRPDEVIGRPAWDLVFPEDRGEGDQRWSERKQGEMGQSEFRLRRKDGTEVWFHAATSPLRDAEGRFAGALGLFADITERRRADEALRESERHARQLADSMPHIVWTARPDGTVEYFNGRWYEYTGLSPDASLAQPGWRSAVHPEDLGRLLEVRDPAVEEGQVFQADVRLCDRQGIYRWHMVRSVPIYDESGRVMRRFGTATDIDDRMRAEEAMRAGERRFRFLAESIPQMVWTARPEGFIDYTTPRCLEFLGVPTDRVLGWAWMDLLHPDDRLRTVETWERALREGAEYRIEYRFRHGATGEYRWFLAQALPQRNDSGQIVGWYGTCTDIDAQWRTRQEIVRLNRDLRARVAELEDLVRDDPDRHRHREGCRMLRHAVEPGAGADPRDRTGFQRLPVRPARRAAGELPVLSQRSGCRAEDLPMQLAARTGQPVTGAEDEIHFVDGRIKNLYGNASPLFDEDGNPRRRRGVPGHDRMASRRGRAQG